MATVAPTLVDLVARVSLLFAAAAILAFLLRRSSAAARHLVWTFAIAGSLVLPVVTLVGPAWDIPVLPRPAAVARDASDAGATPGTGASIVPSASSAWRETSGNGASSTARPSRAPVTRNERTFGTTSTNPRSVWSSLWLVWVFGFAAVLIRLAVGSARMWWIARRARPLSNGTWLRLARRLAAALGIRDRVTFLEGAPAAMPMTWGLLRPRVLLPGSASEWPLARQRVVLLHELAHVKRRDCLTQLLAQAACAIYWFNPLAWYAAARLRAERERACDDLVLAAGTKGTDYADHLLDIARSMRTVALPTWAAVAMAHRSQLEGRLMAILDPDVPRRFPSRRRSVMLAASVAVIALPIAVITPVPKAAEVVTIIESGDVDAQSLPVPTPAPTPQPRPEPNPSVASPHTSRIVSASTKEAVKDALKETGIPRVALQAAAGVLKDPKTRQWLGSVLDGAIEGVAQGVAGGVPGGVQGGVQGGVERDVERDDEDKRPLDPRAVAALVEALKDSDKEVREHAMQALASMRAPEALGAIRGALKDQDASVREQAAFALGQYRDRASVDALIAALKDASADVREQAVFALGQIRDARAGDAIAASLKDANASVREQSAFALGQLRNRSSIDALGAALKDSSADVREQSAFALGQIGDARAVDALVVAMRDESASVREQAAFALGQIGDARAVEALTAALKDPNAEVRRHAAFALGQVR